MFDFENRTIKKGATSLRGKAALREIKWKRKRFCKSMFAPYGNALNQEALARAHLAQSSGGCDPNGIGGITAESSF